MVLPIYGEMAIVLLHNTIVDTSSSSSTRQNRNGEGRGYKVESLLLIRV